MSFFQAARNMGVMKLQLDRVLFCIAYKVLHQPFFGLKISSQVSIAFAIHYHKGRNCLESSGWLFFEPSRLYTYYSVYLGPDIGIITLSLYSYKYFVLFPIVWNLQKLGFMMLESDSTQSDGKFSRDV